MDEKSNLLVSENTEVDPELKEKNGPEKEHESSTVAKDHELICYFKTSGFGFFHVLLLIVVGLATAADAVEVFSVSFVLPIAENDLNITTAEKGWLIASIFIGEFV